MAAQNIVAVIFDFDDTLTDDSFSQLLSQYKMDPAEFWKEHKKWVERGWDPALSYLNLLLTYVGEKQPLGKLSRADLETVGSGLQFYSGVKTLFSDLRKIATDFENCNPVVEFYVISGGIRDMIDACQIRHEFRAIYASEFETDEDGVLLSVKRAVSFSTKLTHLFEISKGIDPEDSRANPYLVNKAMVEEDRRIPFCNMIYVGDGLTDVPCFSVIRDKGGSGRCFGVFDPTKKNSPRTAFTNLLVPERPASLNAPKYGPTQDLGSLLRVAVQTRLSEIELKSRSVYG